MTEPEFDFNLGAQTHYHVPNTAQTRSGFEFNHAASQFFFSLKEGECFTSDDLVKHAGLPDSGANKNNAVGSWFSTMSQDKWIRWTGRTLKSNRADRHQGTIKEWIKIKG